MSSIKWRAKRNAEGKIVPGCWETDAGYTVAEFRTPAVTYGITRPGERAPFAYTPVRAEVALVIGADQKMVHMPGEREQ